VIGRMKTESIFILKQGYRDDMMIFPDYCSADSAPENCSFTCKDYGFETAKTVSWWDDFLSFSDMEVTDIADKVKIIQTICEYPYWVGDHADSSSPTEVSFWPIHPTIERLLQYKQLARPFLNFSWSAPPGRDNHVCIYDGTERSSGFGNSSCRGHHEYDVTFWSTVVKDADGSYGQKHLTNAEVLDAVLPTGNYSAPYIYDNFLWKHCDKLGIHFKEV